jgi:hypothetical protein
MCSDSDDDKVDWHMYPSCNTRNRISDGTNVALRLDMDANSVAAVTADVDVGVGVETWAWAWYGRKQDTTNATAAEDVDGVEGSFD